MANDGTGVDWDTSAPADVDLRSNGALEIRDLRLGVAIRADKEHTAAAASSAGGEHKEGSAVIYTEPKVEFPTNRPDGSTALTSADEGRQAMVAGWTFIYSGNAIGWGENSSGSSSLTSSFTSFIEVGYAFRAIIVSHGSGQNGLVIFDGVSDQLTRFLNMTDLSGGEIRLEFRTEQDKDTPTDKYQFKWRVATGGNATMTYLVLRG